jgi:hypothetical protein
MDHQRRSSATEAELRFTGLMTSPGPGVAKAKLGQYLQEAKIFRAKKEYNSALLLILVSGEYYWRHHHPSRAAGLLLEAADLFYLQDALKSSQSCLQGALDLLIRKSPLTWWEKEMIGSLFVFAACLILIADAANLSKHIDIFRKSLSKKQQARFRREDGYRVAIALRRAVNRKSLGSLDELETKTTLRSRSEYATLYEYMQGLSERYAIIRDGLIALRREIHQEDS